MLRMTQGKSAQYLLEVCSYGIQLMDEQREDGEIIPSKILRAPGVNDQLQGTSTLGRERRLQVDRAVQASGILSTRIIGPESKCCPVVLVPVI